MKTRFRRLFPWVDFFESDSNPNASFIVATDGSGDYSDIQSAIDALPSSGGVIFVKAGTYTLSSGITFAKSNVTIQGEGMASTIIQFNGASIPKAFSMADNTQRAYIKISDIMVKNSGASGNGIAFDLSHFAQCTFKNIRTYAVNKGFVFDASGTLYNKLYNCLANVAGSGSQGYYFGTTSNENTLYSCRAQGDSNTSGFVINGTHSVKLFDPCVEGVNIGIDLQSGANDITIFSPYLELNATNIKFAANIEAPTIVGGVIIDGTTHNIQNLGGKGIALINPRIQYEQFNYRESLNGFPGKRWVRPFLDSVVTTSQAFTVGRVLLVEFELENDAFIDGIAFVKGATVAGNLRAGIYGPIVTEETCEGAPLLVESGSVVMAASANIPQVIDLTKTLAKAGRYYIALQSDDGTATYMRHGNQNQITGWGQYYDRAGGYGALTSPCPTPTSVGSSIPGVRVRCAGLTTM